MKFINSLNIRVNNNKFNRQSNKKYGKKNYSYF